MPLTDASAVSRRSPLDRLLQDAPLGLRAWIVAASVILPWTDPATAQEPTLMAPSNELAGTFARTLAGDGMTGDLTMGPESPVPRFRKSFFQGFEVRGGHRADLGGGDQSLDESFQEARIGLGVPLLSMDNILGLRPYFRVDQIHGPVEQNPADLSAPETLYDTGVAIFNRRQWSAKISTTMLLTPSVRSDFESSEDAFRLFGLGMVTWQCRPDLALSLGAVYLDRADLGVLPVVGLTWTPTPTWRLDLTMPRPRLSHRLWKNAAQSEAWVFLGGSLAGNSWAVQRDGVTDELSISAIDVMVGYEQIRAGNRGFDIEAGFTLGREMEYERTAESSDLGNALFIRGGWQF